jgi:GxxExxY protein
MLLFKTESFRIIGACMEVHKHLGPGFLESVYQEALAMEFRLQEIPFEEQPEIRLYYKDQLMIKTFKPDFLCFGKIQVEIKAATALMPINEAQVINVLKAAKLPLGLLVNFGEKTLVHKRFANSE